MKEVQRMKRPMIFFLGTMLWKNWRRYFSPGSLLVFPHKRFDDALLKQWGTMKGMSLGTRLYAFDGGA